MQTAIVWTSAPQRAGTAAIVVAGGIHTVLRSLNAVVGTTVESASRVDGCDQQYRSLGLCTLLLWATNCYPFMVFPGYDQGMLWLLDVMPRPTNSLMES